MKTIGKYEIIEEPTDKILEEEILEDNVLGSDKNPHPIDKVTVRRIGPPENIMLPTYSIYHFNNPHTTAEWYQNDDQFVKYHIMGHAPIDAQGPGAESLNEATKNYQHFGKKFMRRSLSDRQIARLDNKHDIDQSIFDLAQEDLEIQYNYNKQRYENGEISEQKWRQLKNRYNRWSKNLGNNQLSLDQKQNPFDYIQVHKPGDIAPALFSIGLPLAVTAAIYGAPYIPWIMKNVAIPIIGGEIVNEATRKISNNYYKDFGDWLYRSTPLDDWTKDTWAETPTKFVADMTNPGYLAPYGKIISKYASKAGKFLSELNPWPLISSTYKDIGVVRPIKNVGSEIVGNLKTIDVRSPVYVTEEVVAPVTSSGVVQTPERFVSSWGWRSPIYRKPKPAPAPAPAPAPTLTPNPVPPVGATTKVEGAGYTFRRPVREMTKRGVKVDSEHMSALNNKIENYSPEVKDAFAAEARKHYKETGEVVSWKNDDMILERAVERLKRMRELRDNIHYGTYVDESRVTQTYTREQLDNFAKELKNHVTEMSYRDPNAQRLNWFSHPITNIFSPKPTAWAANHPILSRTEAAWPLWAIGSSTVWGRDLWSEYLPDALKFLFVRPEESKSAEASQQEQSEPTYDSANLKEMIKQRDEQQSKIDSLNNAR